MFALTEEGCSTSGVSELSEGCSAPTANTFPRSCPQGLAGRLRTRSVYSVTVSMYTRSTSWRITLLFESAFMLGNRPAAVAGADNECRGKPIKTRL